MGKPIAIQSFPKEALSHLRGSLDDCCIQVNAIGALMRAVTALGDMPKDSELLMCMASEGIEFLLSNIHADIDKLNHLVLEVVGSYDFPLSNLPC